MNEKRLKTLCAFPDRLDINLIEKQYKVVMENDFFIKIVDSLNVLIVILNKHRQIVYSNKNYLKMIKCKKIDEILGQRLGETLNCIHSFQEEGGCGTAEACRNCSVLNIFLKAVELKKEVEGEGAIIVSDTGFNKSINFFEKVTPIEFENEIFYVLSFIDATDSIRRKSMERVFFHDIINTTGALRGLLVLLRNQVPSNFEKEVILVESLFDGLVDEIMSQKQLSAAEKEELFIKVTEFDSIKILESTRKLYQTYGNDYNKVIKIDRNSENIKIVNDEALLKRVIGNMIKNAIEATKSNSVVSIGCCKLDDIYIQYWVKNDNYMVEEVQNNLFKRSFSSKGEGRGLGTYSMKLLTEKYLNGSVGFNTNIQEGTKFYINVPIKIESWRCTYENFNC